MEKRQRLGNSLALNTGDYFVVPMKDHENWIHELPQFSIVYVRSLGAGMLRIFGDSRDEMAVNMVTLTQLNYLMEEERMKLSSTEDKLFKIHFVNQWMLAGVLQTPPLGPEEWKRPGRTVAVARSGKCKVQNVWPTGTGHCDTLWIGLIKITRNSSKKPNKYNVGANLEVKPHPEPFYKMEPFSSVDMYFKSSDIACEDECEEHELISATKVGIDTSFTIPLKHKTKCRVNNMAEIASRRLVDIDLLL